MKHIFYLFVLTLFISCDIPRNFIVKPDDPNMIYLLFPTNDVLNRAVIVSGSELFDDSISYYDDNDNMISIARDHLALLPINPKDIPLYVDNLNIIIQKWDDKTDYRKVHFEAKNNMVNLSQSSHKNLKL